MTTFPDIDLPDLRPPFDDAKVRQARRRVLAGPRVEAGVFGTMPSPTGPTIERRGSARPWPFDRFE